MRKILFVCLIFGMLVGGVSASSAYVHTVEGSNVTGVGSWTQWSGQIPEGTNAVQISGSKQRYNQHCGGHILILTDDGTITPVLASNYMAAIGMDYDFGYAVTPVIYEAEGSIRSVTGAVQVSAGQQFGVALLEDGQVTGWGKYRTNQWNSHGFYIPAGLTATYVDAGGDHCLAVTPEGTVVAWGADHAGQCGVPAGLSNVVQVAAGQIISLALKDDGSVVGWGNNGYHQLDIPEGLNAEYITAANYLCAAITTDGSVVVWGDGSYDYSQYEGYQSQYAPPDIVTNPPDGLWVNDISIGTNHIWALLSNGSIVQWGTDTYGDKVAGYRLHTGLIATSIDTYDYGDTCFAITVPPPPPPAASYTWFFPPWDHDPMPSTGEAPLTVQFADTSTGPPTYWLWDFGDGWSSKVQNPTHTFTRAGTYNVTLEVTNYRGSSQVAHTITVTPPKHPIAGFSATPTSGPAPLTVEFSDESSSDITEAWLWEFGDGFTSRAQNPAHTYIVPGTYSVILTAFNQYGSGTETKTNYITVGSGLVSSATVCGIVYDATEHTTIDDATVTIRNATGWSSTTTTLGGGYYEFENLTPGVYTVQGTRPGYASSPTYAVQAYQDTVSTQHIALTISGVSLSGVCYDAEKSTPLPNTIVTATQGSTVTKSSTNTNGTYLLDNFLPSTSITLSASHPGYSHSAITVTPTAEGPITRDLYLIPNNITHSGTAFAGLVTSSRDDQAIQGATVSATTGGGGAGNHTAFTNPTGFYLIDNLAAGQWGVSAKATKYNPSNTFTHTLEENAVTLQSFRLDPANPASISAYTPKQVRLTFLSATGSPIPELSVSAVGSSTTAGTWDWFKSLLGLDVSETNLATSTMTGVTGTDGSITFMMLESVYYTITASNPDLGISFTSNIYPKEDEYVFSVWGADAPSTNSQVSWNFDTTEVNGTHTKLAISYLDKANRTQSFRFVVSDENHVQIHAETLDNANDIEVSYVVENDPGAVVYWGFDATRITTGTETEPIRVDQFIRFSGEGENPLGFGFPQVVRHWMGVLFLICIGGALCVMYGSDTLKFAGPTIGIFTLFLKFIDWLPIGWELAIIIFVLGCLGYIRSVKDERRV